MSEIREVSPAEKLRRRHQENEARRAAERAEAGEVMPALKRFTSADIDVAYEEVTKLLNKVTTLSTDQQEKISLAFLELGQIVDSFTDRQLEMFRALRKAGVAIVDSLTEEQKQMFLSINEQNVSKFTQLVREKDPSGRAETTPAAE
jgi:ribosomal protein L9